MKGIDPQKWGSHAWSLLHRLSFRPLKIDGRALFLALGHLLPCNTCRMNYAEHLKYHPYDGRNVGKWLYELHRRVSRQTNNTADMPTFEEVKEKYQGKDGYDERELRFLAAIFKTHPGKYAVDAEYLKHLETFIRVWCHHSGVTDMPKNYASKTALFNWLRGI